MSGCCKETRTEADSGCCSSAENTTGAEHTTGRCCQQEGGS